MEDKELLQGEWRMISMEIKGVKTSEDHVKKYKLTVSGDRWVVARGEKIHLNAVMKLDQTTEPKAIDLVYKAGSAELLSPGIYKIDADTLTMCRTGGYKGRPKEFKTTPESAILIVWKRLPK
jgi:uncharacterized protein (TIGR03067 family)